jgi:hypothetical protein
VPWIAITRSDERSLNDVSAPRPEGTVRSLGYAFMPDLPRFVGDRNDQMTPSYFVETTQLNFRPQRLTLHMDVDAKGHETMKA